MAKQVKSLPAMQEIGFDPWVGKSSGRWKRQLLQYSCLKKPPDRGAWWVIVHRVAKSSLSNGAQYGNYTYSRTDQWIPANQKERGW